MEEKTLATSERGTLTKKICIGILAVGAIPFIIASDRIFLNLFCLAPSFICQLYTISLALIIIAGILYIAASRNNITVTNKRVYGKALFGNRVDLPLDSISAVGTSMLKGISVATSSGTIKFFDIANQQELHSTIAKLLIDRQEKPTATATAPAPAPASDADELLKYKTLLDSGAITQDEFDAKKKQILSL